MTAEILYIDTSCFLKLLIPEPESQRVMEFLEKKSNVIVSSITLLEAHVQLRGFQCAGKLTSNKYSRLVRHLEKILNMDPFNYSDVDGILFETAMAQVKHQKTHCRTMDRLHLSAMQILDIRHLYTHDVQQASAAKSLGFRIATPHDE